MGTILVKSALNALKIEVFKKKISLKKFNLVAHFLLLTFFENFNFVKGYEFDLMVIFDQWPKLHLGLDVRPEIPILKGLY